MARCAAFPAVLFDVTVPLRRAAVFAALLACFYINSAAAATILVYGDSLSAAYGLAQREGWPALLQERLTTEKFNYQVMNASISGETTAGGASRIRATLATARPAVVILELGANDGLRGLPIEEMKRNLNRIIDACRDARAQVLMVGMRLPPNYGTRYTGAFAQAYADTAARYRLPLVPFLMEGFAEQRELFQSDGLHPVAAAEGRILDNIWPVLEPLLTAAPRRSGTGSAPTAARPRSSAAVE